MNQWFRMYSEFATDPKVQMMSEQDQRRLVMLFCMRCNGDVTLHETHIAFHLRITIEEWRKTKEVFIANGFIDSDNKLLNWDKRQYRSDSSLERVRKHRSIKRNGDVTNCNVTVTAQNRTDTEQNRTLERSDFQKVYEAAIDIFPDLIAKNTAIIHQWLNGGCKPSLIIEQMTLHKGKKIKSFEYFKDIIPNAKATAEAKMPAGVVTSYRSNESPKANVIKLGGKNATIS